MPYVGENCGCARVSTSLELVSRWLVGGTHSTHSTHSTHKFWHTQFFSLHRLLFIDTNSFLVTEVVVVICSILSDLYGNWYCGRRMIASDVGEQQDGGSLGAARSNTW